MTKDVFWDDLGIAWCAIHSEINTFKPCLEKRLRRESLLITACIAAGLLLGFGGTLLGVFTLWSGWTSETWNFVTRGAALVAGSSMLVIAALELLPVRANDQASPLPSMIDLTIARSERLLATIRLGMLVCAIAAALGLAGTAIRTYFSRPPAVSPILDLTALALIALGLFLYSRRINVQLAKFRYLKHTLAVDSI
jgi:hypothetical protein